MPKVWGRAMTRSRIITAPPGSNETNTNEATNEQTNEQRMSRTYLEPTVSAARSAAADQPTSCCASATPSAPAACSEKKPTVLSGKDTRSPATCSSLRSKRAWSDGVDVLLTGPLPDHPRCYLTRAHSAELGS